MRQQIIDSFPTCIDKECLHIENSITFKVFDREDDCCFICSDINNEPDSLSCFLIDNPSNKEIHFLAIDKCAMHDCQSKKCDFAIFDDNTFCFVEIKVSSRKKKRERKTEAYDQLKSTIHHFKQRINFDNYSVEAFICCGTKNTIPKCNSKQMGRTKELYDNYNVSLYEGNATTFI